MKKLCLIIALIFTACTSYALNSHMIITHKIYSVGIIPLDSKIEIFKKWNPLLTQLAKNSRFKFKVLTNDTIIEYEDYLKLAAYDFALVSNYQYENIIDKDEYNVLSLDQDIEKKLLEFSNIKDNLYLFIVKKSVKEKDIKAVSERIKNLKQNKQFLKTVEKIQLRNNLVSIQ